MDDIVFSLIRNQYMSSSVKTFGSNYEAMKQRQQFTKRHMYNKSLDHVFKSRYQALTQSKTSQQAGQKLARTKLVDVFQQPSSTNIVKQRRRKSHDQHLEHL
jgi:hypothetical protein